MNQDILSTEEAKKTSLNELTVAEVESFERFEQKDVLIMGILASREEDQDPIDNAIITKARALKLNTTVPAYKVIAFKPFDPVAKRTEATIEDAAGVQFKVSKGAPQIILSLVYNKEAVASRVNELVNNFAAKGYRSLGVSGNQYHYCFREKGTLWA